ILSFIPFPDHYSYSRYDLEYLQNNFLSLQADYLVTTEKDAMRLQSHPEFLKIICVLRMEMEIKTSSQSFENFIVERLISAAQSGWTR
ncbi:MAG: tetraacyldisaccharide 4'-kinase, partial [Smithellaceae bacterium]